MSTLPPLASNRKLKEADSWINRSSSSLPSTGTTGNDWVRVQQKSFTRWINSHLTRRGLTCGDILVDLSDGILLMNLMSEIMKADLPKYNKKPVLRAQIVDNVSIAMSYVKSLGIKLHSISAENIMNKDQKLTLGAIWTIIHSTQIVGITIEDQTAREGLLRWVQRCIRGYNNVDVDAQEPGPGVVNFDNSWKSGLALAALIHHHRPDLVNYEVMRSLEPSDRYEILFKVAEEKLDIVPLLDVADMTMQKPDEKSVMTYISSFFHTFASQKTASRATTLLSRFVTNAMKKHVGEATALNKAVKLKELCQVEKQNYSGKNVQRRGEIARLRAECAVEWRGEGPREWESAEDVYEELLDSELGIIANRVEGVRKQEEALMQSKSQDWDGFVKSVGGLIGSISVTEKDAFNERIICAAEWEGITQEWVQARRSIQTARMAEIEQVKKTEADLSFFQTEKVEKQQYSWLAVREKWLSSKNRVVSIDWNGSAWFDILIQQIVAAYKKHQARSIFDWDEVASDLQGVLSASLSELSTDGENDARVQQLLDKLKAELGTDSGVDLKAVGVEACVKAVEAVKSARVLFNAGYSSFQNGAAERSNVAKETQTRVEALYQELVDKINQAKALQKSTSEQAEECFKNAVDQVDVLLADGVVSVKSLGQVPRGDVTSEIEKLSSEFGYPVCGSCELSEAANFVSSLESSLQQALRERSKEMSQLDSALESAQTQRESKLNTLERQLVSMKAEMQRKWKDQVVALSAFGAILSGKEFPSVSMLRPLVEKTIALRDSQKALQQTREEEKVAVRRDCLSAAQTYLDASKKIGRVLDNAAGELVDVKAVVDQVLSKDRPTLSIIDSAVVSSEQIGQNLESVKTDLSGLDTVWKLLEKGLDIGMEEVIPIFSSPSPLELSSVYSSLREMAVEMKQLLESVKEKMVQSQVTPTMKREWRHAFEEFSHDGLLDKISAEACVKSLGYLLDAEDVVEAWMYETLETFLRGQVEERGQVREVVSAFEGLGKGDWAKVVRALEVDSTVKDWATSRIVGCATAEEVVQALQA
jgi:hypothetical protein